MLVALRDRHNEINTFTSDLLFSWKSLTFRFSLRDSFISQSSMTKDILAGSIWMQYVWKTRPHNTTGRWLSDTGDSLSLWRSYFRICRASGRSNRTWSESMFIKKKKKVSIHFPAILVSFIFNIYTNKNYDDIRSLYCDGKLYWYHLMFIFKTRWSCKEEITNRFWILNQGRILCWDIVSFCNIQRSPDVLDKRTNVSCIKCLKYIYKKKLALSSIKHNNFIL